jgi:hypothetical protein
MSPLEKPYGSQLLITGLRPLKSKQHSHRPCSTARPGGPGKSEDWGLGMCRAFRPTAGAAVAHCAAALGLALRFPAVVKGRFELQPFRSRVRTGLAVKTTYTHQ